MACVRAPTVGSPLRLARTRWSSVSSVASTPTCSPDIASHALPVKPISHSQASLDAEAFEATCQACPSGFVGNDDHTGLQTCPDCPPDTYKLSDVACQKCTANSPSPSGRGGMSDCTCDRGFVGESSAYAACPQAQIVRHNTRHMHRVPRRQQGAAIKAR